jgi:protein-tyrosine phosphatase
MVDQLEDPDPMMLNAELADDIVIRQQNQEEVRSQFAASAHALSSRKVISQHPSKAAISHTSQQLEQKLPTSSHSQRSTFTHRKTQPKLTPMNGDEENDLQCGRFPHMDQCACDIQCQIALREINLFEVYPGIVMGPYQSAFKTKQLLEMGVTHVLNLTCREFTKRDKYFTYLDVMIYDIHSEDAKKHFRITNRFIDDARRSGRVLVHSV